MEYVYFKSSDNLGVVDTATGDLVSLTHVDGYQVHAVEQIPGTNECIVLLAWDVDLAKREQHFSNLWRYAHGRGQIWRAELPTTAGRDCYVAFELVGNRLFANSWSCYHVELDLTAGTMQAMTFAK